MCIPNYTTVAEKNAINYNQLQLPITIKTGRQWTNALVLYYRDWGLRVRVASVGGNHLLSESAAEGKTHNMYIRIYVSTKVFTKESEYLTIAHSHTRTYSSINTVLSALLHMRTVINFLQVLI